MLILVRHGRTAANAAGLLQGRLDQPLDELGVHQAAEVARFVTATTRSPIDQVISSPLLRARQTAAAFGSEVVVDERWIELAYGEFEGLPAGNVSSEVWQRWRTDPDFAPDGGESLSAVDRRVRDACRDVESLARNRTVVVVSHVSPMKSAVGWALGADLSISWRTHLSVASVCRISIGNDGPVLVSFNETTDR